MLDSPHKVFLYHFDNPENAWPSKLEPITANSTTTQYPNDLPRLRYAWGTNAEKIAEKHQNEIQLEAERLIALNTAKQDLEKLSNAGPSAEDSTKKEAEKKVALCQEQFNYTQGQIDGSFYTNSIWHLSQINFYLHRAYDDEMVKISSQCDSQTIIFEDKQNQGKYNSISFGYFAEGSWVLALIEDCFSLERTTNVMYRDDYLLVKYLHEDGKQPRQKFENTESAYQYIKERIRNRDIEALFETCFSHGDELNIWNAKLFPTFNVKADTNTQTDAIAGFYDFSSLDAAIKDAVIELAKDYSLKKASKEQLKFIVTYFKCFEEWLEKHPNPQQDTATLITNMRAIFDDEDFSDQIKSAMCDLKKEILIEHPIFNPSITESERVSLLLNIKRLGDYVESLENSDHKKSVTQLLFVLSANETNLDKVREGLQPLVDQLNSLNKIRSLKNAKACLEAIENFETGTAAQLSDKDKNSFSKRVKILKSYPLSVIHNTRPQLTKEEKSSVIIQTAGSRDKVATALDALFAPYFESIDGMDLFEGSLQKARSTPVTIDQKIEVEKDVRRQHYDFDIVETTASLMNKTERWNFTQGDHSSYFFTDLKIRHFAHAWYLKENQESKLEQIFKDIKSDSESLIYQGDDRNYHSIAIGYLREKNLWLIAHTDHCFSKDAVVTLFATPNNLLYDEDVSKERDSDENRVDFNKLTLQDAQNQLLSVIKKDNLKTAFTDFIQSDGSLDTFRFKARLNKVVNSDNSPSEFIPCFDQGSGLNRLIKENAHALDLYKKWNQALQHENVDFVLRRDAEYFLRNLHKLCLEHYEAGRDSPALADSIQQFLISHCDILLAVAGTPNANVNTSWRDIQVADDTLRRQVYTIGFYQELKQEFVAPLYELGPDYAFFKDICMQTITELQKSDHELANRSPQEINRDRDDIRAFISSMLEACKSIKNEKDCGQLTSFQRKFTRDYFHNAFKAFAERMGSSERTQRDEPYRSAIERCTRNASRAADSAKLRKIFAIIVNCLRRIWRFLTRPFYKEAQTLDLIQYPHTRLHKIFKEASAKVTLILERVTIQEAAAILSRYYNIAVATKTSDAWVQSCDPGRPGKIGIDDSGRVTFEGFALRPGDNGEDPINPNLVAALCRMQLRSEELAKFSPQVRREFILDDVSLRELINNRSAYANHFEWLSRSANCKIKGFDQAPSSPTATMNG